MGLRESKVNLSWPCYVRNTSVIVKSIISSTSRIESADCDSVFDVAHCSILKCTDVTWMADPSSNSACHRLPVGLCLVSESTNIHLGPHRGPVAPSWYPDPHTACSWLRELLWTGKQKKCFCQACGDCTDSDTKSSTWKWSASYRPRGRLRSPIPFPARHARTHAHTRMHAVTHSRPHAQYTQCLLSSLLPRKTGTCDMTELQWGDPSSFPAGRAGLCRSRDICKASCLHVSPLSSRNLTTRDWPTVLSHNSPLWRYGSSVSYPSALNEG